MSQHQNFLTDLPNAVLFCCSMNSIRSPMAEGILKKMMGTRIYIDSVGVRESEPDGFMIAVMDEININMRNHHCKIFKNLQDDYFDLIIPMSPEAQHHAIELTRTIACEIEFWHIFDPSIVEGSRENRIQAYRKVRDQLQQKIYDRFSSFI
ncbi:MAG: low molecular weight phosphatase family protein [Pseudomonadota bacterium]